jgi:hypothetical protein
MAVGFPPQLGVLASLTLNLRYNLPCSVSLVIMSSLQEIESAVSKLSADELAAFRVWFAEFDAEIWDQQFEEDVAAGRLDKLAERALQHLREGRCTDL